MVCAVAARAAFRSIQSVNLVEALHDRPRVMKSVPKFLRGPYRMAMRCALEEILAGARGRNVEREENGWKLLMLLLRMLLHKPPRGGGIPEQKLSCSPQTPPEAPRRQHPWQGRAGRGVGPSGRMVCCATGLGGCTVGPWQSPDVAEVD